MGLAKLRCGATPPSEKVHCVPILFWVGLRSIPKDGGHRSTHTSERWLEPSAHISLSSALYPAHTSLSSSFLGGRPPPFQAPNPIPPLQRSTTHRHHGSSPIQRDSTWILKDKGYVLDQNLNMVSAFVFLCSSLQNDMVGGQGVFCLNLYFFSYLDLIEWFAPWHELLLKCPVAAGRTNEAAKKGILRGGCSGMERSPNSPNQWLALLVEGGQHRSCPIFLPDIPHLPLLQAKRFVKTSIKHYSIFITRSLGVPWVPISNWRPCGPVDFALHAPFGMLRPCDPRKNVQTSVVWIVKTVCVL